ncbi:MAG: carbon storage regulator CsrA [Epsilonproteobacteria bacterium]|nr:carbon storage regulator CsrA [Campylobacterota bacterium]
MLVISRRVNEKIKIGEDIEIVVVEIGKNQVKIGIEAPKNVHILRGELIEEVKTQNIRANKIFDDFELEKYSKVLNEN